MADAFYQAGMFYRSTGELEKSEEMFKIAADYGMVDAEYEIFKTQLKNEETEEIVQELKKVCRPLVCRSYGPIRKLYVPDLPGSCFGVFP